MKTFYAVTIVFITVHHLIWDFIISHFGASLASNFGFYKAWKINGTSFWSIWWNNCKILRIHGNSFWTYWGRATHVCVSKLTTIGSDNGLSPGWRQAIIWIIAWILLIRPLGTNLSEIWIGIQTFSFKKIHLKMASAKWRPFVSASMG